MLVTSCLDNVCRIWVETILPDDGLVEMEQFDPSLMADSKQRANRHKNRFIQRLKTIRFVYWRYTFTQTVFMELVMIDKYIFLSFFLVPNSSVPFLKFLD